MPGDNGVDAAGVDLGQHPLVRRSCPAARRRCVVVLEQLHDLPAPSGAVGLAVSALSFDTGPLATRVRGDPGVDARLHGAPGLLWVRVHRASSFSEHEWRHHQHTALRAAPATADGVPRPVGSRELGHVCFREAGRGGSHLHERAKEALVSVGGRG